MNFIISYGILVHDLPNLFDLIIKMEFIGE